MGKLINYSTSFKAIDDFFDKYNYGKRHGDPTRLKQTAKSVAKEVIRLYGAQLYKEGLLFVQGDLFEELYDKIPPLSTNNEEIGRKIGVTGRTVRTHLAKLIEHKLFKKASHGSKKNVNIWVNSEILRVKKRVDLAEIEKDIKKQVEEVKSIENKEVQNDEKKKNNEKKLKNFPPKGESRSTTGNIDNNNNTPDDNVNKVSAKAENNSDSLKSESQETTIKKGLETGESKNQNKKIKNFIEKKYAADKSLMASKKYYAEMIYSLANNLIYNDWELFEYQEDTSKKHILSYFHAAKNKEQVRSWYKKYCECIAMAANFYKNHPKYEKYQPATYFDPENKNGFKRTWKWILKKSEDKLKMANNRLLGLLIDKMKNNLDSISVYNDCIKKLTKLNNPELLKKFNQKIIELKK